MHESEGEDVDSDCERLHGIDDNITKFTAIESFRDVHETFTVNCREFKFSLHARQVHVPLIACAAALCFHLVVSDVQEYWAYITM